MTFVAHYSTQHDLCHIYIYVFYLLIYIYPSLVKIFGAYLIDRVHYGVSQSKKERNNTIVTRSKFKLLAIFTCDMPLCFNGLSEEN